VNCTGIWVPFGPLCNVPCGEGQQSYSYSITVNGTNGIPCPFNEGDVTTEPCIGNDPSCGLNTAAAPSGKRYPVLPYFHCFEKGLSSYAYLGYENRGQTTIILPVEQDIKNYFDPASTSNQLLTNFLPGVNRFSVRATFSSSYQGDCIYSIDANASFNALQLQYLCPGSMTVILRDLISMPSPTDVQNIQNCLQTALGIPSAGDIVSTASVFMNSTRINFVITTDPITQTPTAAQSVYQIATANILVKLKNCTTFNLTGVSWELPVPELIAENPGFVVNDQAVPSPPINWILYSIIGGSVLGVILLVVIIVCVVCNRGDGSDEIDIYRRM